MQNKEWILMALQKAKLDLQGQFLIGSNYTFMCNLTYESADLTAVYKPARGEQPLWDFPPGTLAKREVAAFWVSEALGWDLVPPTVYRQDELPLGPGSLQLYIDHDPEYHYFRFTEAEKQRLRPVALFDLLVNNADRKAGHILCDRQDHLWLIDHGVCFHTEDKLRTVVWDFAGEAIDKGLSDDLCTFTGDLQVTDEYRCHLEELLSRHEIGSLAARAQRLVESGFFPYPSGRRRPYPWPPV
jgi:uncharacterized repeat protein (TIGR03843 family)